MIKDSFKDIIKHTHGLSFISDVKLTGKAGKTKIGAIADDKSVVLYGELNNQIEDFEGHEVGLSRMAVLSGYLKFPMFDTADAKITIEKEERNGTEIPAEINFDSTKGHVAKYRFMGPDAAAELKIPSFNNPPWGIAIVPTEQNLSDLNYFGGILGGFEPNFEVVLENKTLKFRIGGGAGDRSVVPIAENVEGELKTVHRYPLMQVLSILKLSSNAQCAIQFSDVGAMMITIDSGLGIYDYIIPAKMH